MSARTTSATLVFLLLCALAFLIAGTPNATLRPGKIPDGRTLLPNGWALSPAGRPAEVGVGPLGMALSPDGSRLAVLNCGVGKHSVSILDTTTERVTETIPLERAYIGISWPTPNEIYVAGATGGNVWKIVLGEKPVVTGIPIKTGVWVSSVAATGDGSYCGTLDSGELFRCDGAGKVLSRVWTRGKVYSILVGGDARIYVSDWNGARVLVYDPSLKPLGEIAVGPHPQEMVLTTDGRLFVACAADNTVYAIDAGTRKVTEKIEVSVHPNSPEGSAPTGITLSPNCNTLYCAVADNNCVAVMDVSKRNETKLKGFIPAGWYTCGVRASRDGKHIFSLASKGSTPKPNPKKEYIGTLLGGQVFFTDVPDGKQLSAHTRAALANCPYRNPKLRPTDLAKGSILPKRPGDSSPIKYVVYVIKENRTYDQVMGDIPKGNRDASLVMYGEKITPNQHKLANEYVLLDNFYVDAEVSADGHNWSDAAYANEYVEKTWPYNYGGHGGGYDFESENALSLPQGGYIWDACRRSGVTYRIYGEFADEQDGKYRGRVEGTRNDTCAEYPGWDMKIQDQTRLHAWLKEFREFEKNGKLPRFMMVYFPQDHTAGTGAGSFTPNACVADNDLAVGKLIEALSHSKFWPQMAMFILEDDAQNGPDHIDAHRSPCLVISPYSRLGVVDSNLYTTCSVVRSIGLFLGFQSLNQYDAGASPMYSLFRGKRDTTPFTALPAQVDINAKNPPRAAMWRESLKMNFREPDAIREDTMNRILWAAAKPGVPYPALRRSSIGLAAPRGR